MSSSKMVFSDLYKEFGAKDEEEMLSILTEDALTIPCIECKKEIDFFVEKLFFVGDEPVCKKCYEKLYLEEQ